VERHVWSRLKPPQLGRYAEYLVKMEFTLHGFDVYTAEVDDKGIDFVIRRERIQGTDVSFDYYDVQVKSVRKFNYVFFLKEKFALRDDLLAAIGLFEDGSLSRLYSIPATAWQRPNALFADRNYEGLKSKPEWGLNLSRRNLTLLEPHRFERTVGHL
jgi:hypothetical protein